jgi:electron transport complex protein RnfB
MHSEDLYRSLQQHLDRMPIGFPATESGVELRILKQLFTPEQAEVALELSTIPEPARAIHKRFRGRRSPEDVDRILRQMSGDGLILTIEVRGEMRYAKLIFVIGFFERQIARLTPQLAADAREYMQGPFGAVFHSKKTTKMRIVPVDTRIGIERGVATHDDIRAFVNASGGPFATMKCICRHGQDLLGEPCRQTKLRENCLTFGRAAEFMTEHGAARFITREEMLSLIDQADAEGLVLQPENTKSPLFVCCCCGCCCGVLTSAKRFDRPADHFSSNFLAAVDELKCESCGTCESRCPMEAIQNNGAAKVDRARCIGCALCVTACPSGALHLKAKEEARVPPADAEALFVKILQERYGPWGLLKLMTRKTLGMQT